MKKRKNSLRTIVVFILLLLIVIVPGPSQERSSVPLDGSSLYAQTPSPTPSPVPLKTPVLFWKEETQINGNPQALYFVELNLCNPYLEVMPVLSQDRVFGFELLMEMNNRYEATATINAGFNFSYGQPSGLVIQRGRILSGSIGYGRILLINEQKAWFQEAPFRVWVGTEDLQLPVDRVNPYPKEKGILIFTPEYGPTNRIDGKYTTTVVRNNLVVSSAVVEGETEIPKEGFLVVDLRAMNSPLLHFAPGSQISFSWEHNAEYGYQCSGSLVENGVNVAKDEDAWAGNLRIPTPRTAVGLKDESTLVFVVVDGRQPGYSTGVTGKQLADILISAGVTEAAILDGGASSQMIVENETVNRPSTGERLLASAFVALVKGP